MIDTALFTAQNLSFSYGDRLVLDNLNLTLAKGKFHGLVGPNGSGKTTMVDVLMGRRKPDSGKAMFIGQRPDNMPRRQLARQLALVPQEYAIGFAFTVREVVAMGRHPYLPRFGSLTSQDLAIIDRSVEEIGLKNLADRSVTELSGGEKQRVVLARALAQDAPVMILDEPTANLDVRHSLDILEAVSSRVAQGKLSALTVMHDLNLAAAFCDELIFLFNGRVHAAGPTTKVLTPENIETVFGVRAAVSWNDYAQSNQVVFRRDGDLSA